MTEFGNTLRRFREDSGIGSRELSRMVGMTGTYVSQLERGAIKKPNYYTAVRLFDCLSVPKDTRKTILESMEIHPPGPIETSNKGFEGATFEDTMPWLNEFEEACKQAIQRIDKSLIKFFDQDRTRAKTYIENLDMLLNTDKHTFLFSCKLLNRNYADLSLDQKKKIIHFFETVIDPEIENNKTYH